MSWGRQAFTTPVKQKCPYCGKLEWKSITRHMKRCKKAPKHDN